jgi:glycerol 3-phosphatase-2
MALLDRYDCFLLDLDGVVMRGDAAVAGAPEEIERMRSRGRRPVFLTNNSSRTPQQVATWLCRAGVGANDHEVVTSALATAELLARDRIGRAFVVGELGILEALRGKDIDVIDGDPDEVDAVVVGWDRRADYAKLRRACLLVERGARLVATNADAAYPGDDGRWPGAGALLSVVTVTTGASPEIVGKPYPALFHAALERGGGSRPLVVGDRLDTDVAGAANVGWDSMLVLTGISSRRDVSSSSTRPTYVADDLSGLSAEPEPRLETPATA